MGKNGLVIGYEHRYRDNRVFLKSVLAFSRCFEKVFYVVKEERPKDLAVPENVVDIVVPNFPIRTIKRTLFYDRKFRKTVLGLEEKVDLILIHNLPGLLVPGEFAKALKRKFQCPVIVDLHEFTPEVMIPSLTGKKGAFLLNEKLIFQPYLKKADGAMVVSSFVKRYLESLQEFAKKPVLVVPNFSHYSPICPANEKKESRKVGILGMIHKGFGETVLNHFCRTMLEKTKYTIHFVGSSRQGAKEAGLYPELLDHPQVFFHGMLPYEEMMRLVSTMVFTFSQYSTWRKNNVYSLPNKFFDSICAGTPVATSIQMKEIASWVKQMGVGFITDTSRTDWADQIFSFFDSPQNISSLQENIKKNQSRFCWDSHKKEYKEFLLSFVNENSGRGLL